MTETLIEAEALDDAGEVLSNVLAELDRKLLGRADLHRKVLFGLLSRGHVLLEGLPGLGKTALIKALGEILMLDFSRVQFTPDLMPADILGAHILQQANDGRREMEFQPGPVFTNILLADEINRASPKTQSALLEAMQEGAVTLMGTTRDIPRPFFVMASQNPIEQQGTYPLPEAQLDRFLFKLDVGQMDVETLSQLATDRMRGSVPQAQWRLSRDKLNTLFALVDRVHLAPQVGDYIARLVHATHPGSHIESIARYVDYGASPRAVFALSSASRAHALLAGRPTVGFEDVRALASPVLNHRMILNYKARIDRVLVSDLIAELLREVPAADLQLPRGISIGD